MQFEFATATRIIFGNGAIRQVAPLAATFGRSALIVTSRSVERAAPLVEQLQAQNIASCLFSVCGEPTTTIALDGVRLARESDCDLVIAIGGGAALDTGKAIAALLTNSGDLLDYLEVIGKGQPLTTPPAPFIAVPTTAGTGSEVTRNAVLSSPEHRVKVSLRSALMLPRVAVVDPELTHSQPPRVTADSGLDALTQCLEPFVSNAANPVTDAICREGLRRAARSLRRAYENGNDAVAREDMALAALFGGLALANAKLGAVHGFAGVIGGMFPAPHGAICARLLPFVMEANLRALESRAPDSPALVRYAEVAQILTEDANARAADGVEWVMNLCEALTVRPLAAFGLSEADIPAIVAQAQGASSMKGNPIGLTDGELVEVLENAM